MHSAILIAAWISFGQLSFDLSSIAAALDRTLESLQRKSFRAVAKSEADSKDQKPEQSESETVYLHSISEAGHYFERKTEHEWWIDVFNVERPFTIVKKDSAWVLQGKSDGNTEKSKIDDISQFAFGQLCYFGERTLSEILLDHSKHFAALKLDRNRVAIWCREVQSKKHIRIIEMQAIVRLSESGQLGYCESASLYSNNTPIFNRRSTTSDADFRSDTIQIRSISNAMTHYPNCRSVEDVLNCKNPVDTRYRTAIQKEVSISYDQLSLPHYGITVESYDKYLRQPEPPKPRAPRITNNQRDLALAIGIPVVLLVVILYVIRKT